MPLRTLVPSEKLVSFVAILSIPVTTGGTSLRVYFIQALKIGRLFIKD